MLSQVCCEQIVLSKFIKSIKYQWNFQTSGNVCLGFQNQGVSLSLCALSPACPAGLSAAIMADQSLWSTYFFKHCWTSNFCHNVRQTSCKRSAFGRTDPRIKMVLNVLSMQPTYDGLWKIKSDYKVGIPKSTVRRRLQENNINSTMCWHF